MAGSLVLALCLISGLAFISYQVLDSDGDDPPISVGGQPTPGEVPSGDPFAGTPAAFFAEGAAGIELPIAEAAGDFSLDEVAETLELVREALIAARIDRTMLLDRNPDRFLDLVAPATHDFLLDDFREGRFAYFATQLADGARLAVDEPRVEGNVTYEATEDRDGIRVIEVVTNFVWAYAFEIDSSDPELDGIVTVRERLVWHLPHEDDVPATSTGLWLWEGNSYSWGIDCDAYDDSLLGPQTELVPGVGAADESQIFDPDASLNIPDTC